MASDRLRVLLIAEACNPTWTSVPLVGYNMARALAERSDLDLTIVSQVRNRAALLADPIASLARLSFIDNEWVAAPLHKLITFLRGPKGIGWTLGTAMNWPSYIAFEEAVFRRFAGDLHAGRFDLIHRLTPLTPTVGSPLARLARTPMLLGPLNGGLPWPKQYPHLRRQEREWLVPLRQAYTLLPYHHGTFSRLAGVIAGSRHTASEIPHCFRGRRFYMPENGVDPERFPIASGWPEPTGRFRFITVGRLVPYKGVDLIIEAMARSTALRNCELLICGDGPERENLEELVRNLKLQDNVQFTGWLDQHGLARELRQAQAFAFPSLREFGGGVVLEALASGLPAIIVNYGGPAELVTSDCGMLLPLLPREPLIEKLQEAMEELAGDAARCRSLGVNACRRVREEFTWPAKAARVVSFYHQTFANRSLP